MTRYSSGKWDSDYRRGRKVFDERPAKPPRAKRTATIDEEALAQAKRELAAIADHPEVLGRGSNVLPATGLCHTCERPISGERRFCGPCLARRSA